MATEHQVQTFVHKLEEGDWVRWVYFALLLTASIFGIYRFLFTEGSPGSFRGLSSAKGMEQAQIAREVARGNGFSTKFIRPLAITQFQKHKGGLPEGNIPDTYQAPLNPWVNSLALRLCKGSWKMTTKDVVYTSDRVISAVAMIFFILSMALSYRTALRLFDQRLALVGMGLLLVCDTFWQFSMSGLPQMLMLLIFSGCCYALVRAVEAGQLWEGTEALDFYTFDTSPRVPTAAAEASTPGGEAPPLATPGLAIFREPLFWLLCAAVLFGLLTLAHGLAAWIFGGALLFCALHFRPRAGSFVKRIFKNPALWMAVVYLLVYAPWIMRNQRVCGAPFGIATYSIFHQLRGTESQVMRTQELSFKGINPITFRLKVVRQAMDQFAGIYGHFGSILVAPLFFLSLMHLFKGRTASSFRWCLFAMWVPALIGMGAFGLESPVLDANDLHILFAPMMTFYGVALVLVMWSRLEINIALVRYGFVGLIYLISGLPLFNTLFGRAEGRVQWPPYVPPFISLLGDWVDRPDEVLCSDMPWAVAWYADRKCLWLPITVKEFVQLNDDNTLHGRLVGLYLTPITGNRAFIADVVKGEYKDWYPFIIRNVQIRDFPLRAVTALPIDNECVFYCDRDRWSTRVE